MRMTTPDTSVLEAAVDALLQQHVAAYEAVIRGAIGRKVAASTGPASRSGKTKPVARRPRKSGAIRRSGEELAALGERLFAVIEQFPGESMAVLSSKLGVASHELGRPAARLKKDGRVRTMGERSRTRYFAMAARPAS
jgi:hypothetical protein